MVTTEVNFGYSFVLHENASCDYSLDQSQCCNSNEDSQGMFLYKKRNIFIRQFIIRQFWL